jgi:hypothetical protein
VFETYACFVLRRRIRVDFERVVELEIEKSWNPRGYAVSRRRGLSEPSIPGPWPSFAREDARYLLSVCRKSVKSLCNERQRGTRKDSMNITLNQQQSEMKVIQSECMQCCPCLKKMGKARSRSEESINNG